MEQTKTSKEVVILTSRDMDILRYLGEHRFMVKRQISAIFFADNSDLANACQRRLDKLEESGFIKKFEKNPQTKQPRLYTLTQNGLGTLRTKGLDYGFEEVMSVDPRILSHDLSLVNIRAVFERLGAKSWQTERVYERTSENREFIPDAVFEFGSKHIAVEFETSLKEISKLSVKYRWYQERMKFLVCLYVINGEDIRNKFRELEERRSKVAFIVYQDLLEKEGKALVENHEAKIQLKEIFK